MWVYLRVLAAAAVLLTGTGRARAWANAHVDEAAVQAELLADGRTRVEVELLLNVEGGWVEALELPGFDALLGLDEATPARLLNPRGDVRTLRAELSGPGSVVLRFARRDAPRRGEHRLQFAYFAETALHANADGGLGLAYTLPGWEAGLRRASVVLLAPAGTRPVSDEEGALAPRSEPLGERARLVFERVHLPRRTAWTVRADVPGGGAADARVAAPGPERSLTTGLWVALFVVGIGRAARLARKPSGAGRGYLPLPPLVPELGALAGALWWHASALAALASWVSTAIALALWSEPGRASLGLGRRVDVPRAAREEAVRGGRAARLADALLDASTAPGAAALAVVCVAPVLVDGAYDLDGAAWGLGVLCALPAWFGGTRRAPRPERAAELRALLATAGSFSLPGWALRITWLVDRRGALDPALKFVPGMRSSGVWDAELRPARGGCEAELRLCLDAHLGSACAARFSGRVLRSGRGVGGRAVLVLAGDDAAPVLSWLSETAAQRAQGLAVRFALPKPPEHGADPRAA